MPTFEAPEAAVSRHPSGLARVVAVVVVVGLAITAAAAWAAWSLDHRNEERLLRTQTRQVAAVISAEIVNITSPLEVALSVAHATDGDAAEFETFMSTHIGEGQLFIGASLWRVDGDTLSLIATVGDGPETSSTSVVDDLADRAKQTEAFAVAGFPVGNVSRVAYAMSNHAPSGFLVVAERGIPANRQVRVNRNAAFSNLHYATYLGDSVLTEDLATTDMPPADLPLRGLTERVTIPFGDTVITITASPRDRLGGSLGAALPWVFLGVGLVVTASAAAVTVRLVKRRRAAEQSAVTIAELYQQLDDRFGEQRNISETLQRALLPLRNPTIPGLELASRFMAGSRGVEVGGDWFSVVPVDDDHFAFVVGDVSGRGVSAATVMARLRFTLRAYLIEGHQPDRALAMCNRQIDIVEDGHFATVLVGVGNRTTRTITVANAGHFDPLVLGGGDPAYIPTEVGLPLGVDPSATYRLTTFDMPPGSTLIAFTDGLVERRGEDLLLGLDRLAAAAVAEPASVDALLGDILSAMIHDGSEDDIAILAFRWAPAGAVA